MVFELGKKYRILNVNQHEDCQGCDNCVILSMLTRGIIPDSEFTPVLELGENIIINVQDVGEFAIRKQYLEQCECEQCS